MNDERWLRIEALFHAARSLPEGARSTFLRSECAGDHELLHDLESLLAQHATADEFLSQPLVGPAMHDPTTDGQGKLVGSRLGSYELQEWLGSGATGEVYRARDPRLGGDVAVKVLRQAFVSDPGRLVRLKRDAHVLATLKQPGIVAPLVIEETGGTWALIMEMIDGRVLADHLERGSMPLDDVLQIARQIVDALEAAHEVGIVHGDLKPSNVMITPAGTVKVLDFGLNRAVVARVVRSELQDTAASLRTTISGPIGCAGYTSPEQAQGKAVDKRTDIWAFGCLLYEMLTGVRAFRSYGAADTVSAIINTEPDWRALPATVPANVHRLLARALDKDPRRRLRDIGEARVELENAVSASGGHATEPGMHEPIPRGDGALTPDAGPGNEPADPDLRSSSVQLLRRAQAGDRAALERLFERYLPALHRWAHGRLPSWARAFSDTADLVQDAVLRTFKGLPAFEPRLEHALQAYLRQAVQNRILDELRRAGRQPQKESVDSTLRDRQPSPLDQALEQEDREHYRTALERLSDEDRQLIVARLDLGYSYEQIALLTGRPSSDAARVAIRRAVQKLAEEMRRVERAESAQ